MAFNAPHTPFHKPPVQLLSGRYASLSGTQEDIQANPRAYWEASMQAMDNEIARLLEHVDRKSTNIIFIGDNGTSTFVIQPPFSASRAKASLYEGGTHVPLLISGPDVVSPGRESTALVNAADLFATILEMAGTSVKAALPANHPCDSVSLMPILQNGKDSTRYAYSEQFGGTLTPSLSGQAIRNAHCKLISFDDGRHELYDMDQDPLETNNLLRGKLTGQYQEYYTELQAKLGLLLGTWTDPQTRSASGGPQKGQTSGAQKKPSSGSGQTTSSQRSGGGFTSPHGGRSNAGCTGAPPVTASYLNYLFNKETYDTALANGNKAAPSYSFSFIYDELLSTDARGVPLYLQLTGLQDSDGDSIPDVMEDFFGLDKTDSSDADLSPNASGYANLDRYLAGQDVW